MTLGKVHLTPQLVQAVRDAVDLVELVSEHTQVRKRGKRYVGLCPLHKEKTPSFSVDPDRGLYYCFGCGVGGDAIKFHMQMTGDDFPATIEALAQRYGIPLPTAAPRRGSRSRDEVDPQVALTAAEEFFADQLKRSSEARRYLAERQIPPELIARFRLGYAPGGWRGLIEALHPRVSLGELEAAGLALPPRKPGDRPVDRFRNRLMFPIRTASGRLVGFGGRTLGADRAKYLNTSETERFQKRHLLFGLDLARQSIRQEARVFLVEGYFDVLGAVASGVEWTVASMGTALSREQSRLLGRYTEEVIIGYDGDEAGEEASRRALSILLSDGVGVRRARFQAGQDPDSLRLEAGGEAVREKVATAADAVVLELERLIPPGIDRHPRRQAKAAKAARELLGSILDPIVRYGYGRHAADRVGVPAELFWGRSGEVKHPGGQGSGPAAVKIVRSLEERALQLLLSPDAELPDLGGLPPAEAFLDPVCRNIFQAFCDLYREVGKAGLDARSVLAQLPGGSEAIDRAAQILVQEAPCSKDGDLLESLGQLKRRWQQRRLRELAREIREAQRSGDSVRLERLLEEKTGLSRDLHQLSQGSVQQ